MASQIRSVDNTVSSQWVDPDNAFTENDQCTVATTNEDQNVYNIIGTPFTIPGGATIVGIEVKTVRATDENDYYEIELQDKVPAWKLKTGTFYFAVCADGVQETLGGPTDDWGGTWDAAHINSASFQIRLTYQKSGKANALNVDHIEVVVYYELLTAVGLTAAIIYHNRVLAANTRSLLYHSKILVGNTEILVYNILLAVGLASVLIYNARDVVKQSQSLFYHVRDLIGDTGILQYHVRGLAGRTRSLVYHLRNLAGKVGSFVYHIRELAGNTETWIYNVFGGVAVGLTCALVYHVRNLTGKTDTLKYHVRDLTGKTGTLKYHVQDLVGRTRSFIYKVRGQTGKTKTFKHHTRVLVGANHTFIYHVAIVRVVAYVVELQFAMKEQILVFADKVKKLKFGRKEV